MDEADRQRLEATLRERAGQGDLAGVATIGLEAYGPELLGYMAAAGASVDTDECFAAFAAALWQSLPRFRWESSFRVWAYAIARRVASQARRHALVAARRAAPGDDALTELAELAERVRSATAPFLRTSVRDELSRLRATLTADEQTLLIVRVDRGLSWFEIAQVFAGEDEAPDEAELRRRASTLRKRFERLKARLAELLRDARAPR